MKKTGTVNNDYTQDSLNTALAWKQAAIQDGWVVSPTYRFESVETAATLNKDGFHASVITRPQSRNLNPCGRVSVWGPDGLCIELSKEYNWEQIKSGVTTCPYCKATGVATERVGFAGRCCATCLAMVRPQVEFAGWDR